MESTMSIELTQDVAGKDVKIGFDTTQTPTANYDINGKPAEANVSVTFNANRVLVAPYGQYDLDNNGIQNPINLPTSTATLSAFAQNNKQIHTAIVDYARNNLGIT